MTNWLHTLTLELKKPRLEDTTVALRTGTRWATKEDEDPSDVENRTVRGDAAADTMALTP